MCDAEDLGKERETVDYPPEGGVIEPTNLPKQKKAKLVKGGALRQPIENTGDVTEMSLNAQVLESFCHKDFNFRRYDV